MRVSEIRVNQIRVNQGLGVLQIMRKYLLQIDLKYLHELCFPDKICLFEKNISIFSIFYAFYDDGKSKFE